MVDRTHEAMTAIWEEQAARQRRADDREAGTQIHDELEVRRLLDDLGAARPHAGLAAVRELRRLLAIWEREHVDRARHDGWGWAEIARVLGRHRQSVHRQYAATDR